MDVDQRGVRGPSLAQHLVRNRSLDEHFFPEVERVVANNGHWWIVEKHGKARAVAEKLDPRKREATSS
jgi:hypothetical protein